MTAPSFGATGMTKVSQTKGYNKTTGYTTRIRYVGLRAAAVTAFTSWVADPAVDDVQWVDEKKGIIDVTYVDDTLGGGGGGGGTWDADSTWELIAQDVQLPLLTFGGRAEAPAISAFNKDADQTVLAQVKEAVAQNKRLVLVAGTANDFQNLLCRGVTEYIRNCVILRQSLNVKRTSVAVCRWTGVDRAWLFSGESGSPSHVPAILIGSVSAMPDYDATKKQWLKRAPSLQQIGRNRFKLTQDWWFQRNWSYILYAGTNEDGNP